MGLFGARADAPFDEVRLADAGGTVSTWTRTQFEKLPLLDRVRLLSGGALQFFRDGKQVSVRDALTAV
jgi:hypothetical protein